MVIILSIFIKAKDKVWYFIQRTIYLRLYPDPRWFWIILEKGSECIVSWRPSTMKTLFKSDAIYSLIIQNCKVINREQSFDFYCPVTCAEIFISLSYTYRLWVKNSECKSNSNILFHTGVSKLSSTGEKLSLYNVLFFVYLHFCFFVDSLICWFQNFITDLIATIILFHSKCQWNLYSSQ